MKANGPAGLTYDTAKMQLDMVALGLNPTTLARRTRASADAALRVSRMTVTRFFEGTVQTAKAGLAIARALGHDDASTYIKTTQVAA